MSRPLANLMLAAVSLHPTSAKLCPPPLLSLVMLGDGPIAVEASHCCQVVVKLSAQPRSATFWNLKIKRNGIQFATI